MAKNNYKAHPIDENTYAIEEKTKNMQGLCYLLCGKEKALLIDTCTGQSDLESAVKNLTDLPIVVANTHAHIDHIGGNRFFAEHWFHEADKDIFALHTDPKYALSLLTDGMPRPIRALMGIAMKNMLRVDTSGDYYYFGDGHVFRLGGRDIEAVSTPGHTPGSVCFIDRQARQLYSGDSVCEQGVLLHFAGESCPPEVFLQSMQRLKDMEESYDTIWPGHHGFPAEKSYVDDYLTCAQKIVDGVATYKKTKGMYCASYNRVLISVPAEIANG